ncbi:hypothetical protein Droror1_Dr00027311 [Drosera rotundifolia]
MMLLRHHIHFTPNLCSIRPKASHNRVKLILPYNPNKNIPKQSNNIGNNKCTNPFNIIIMEAGLASPSTPSSQPYKIGKPTISCKLNKADIKHQRPKRTPTVTIKPSSSVYLMTHRTNVHFKAKIWTV